MATLKVKHHTSDDDIVFLIKYLLNKKVLK